MKRTLKFDLGNISPQKVYETLVSILKESVVPPKMKPRRLRLNTYSIFSENPFSAEIKAEHGLTGFSWGEIVSCHIYTQNGTTFLTITSKGERISFGEGPQHRKNILGLYNELNFRLKTEKSPLLDQILSPNEKKIVRFYPIKYEGIKQDCIITNLRLCLCRNQLIRSTINLRDIISTSMGREREYKGVGYFFLASIFLGITSPILILLFVMWSRTTLEFNTILLSIFLPLFLMGIGFVTVGLIKQYDNFLQIQSVECASKLFAQKNIISQLKSVVKMIAEGKSPIEEQVTPTIQTKKEKSQDSESRKYVAYLGSQRYHNDLLKSKKLYEEAQEAVAQGNLKLAINKLSKVVQWGIHFLDADLVYRAVAENAPIRKALTIQLSEKTDPRLLIAVEKWKDQLLYDIREKVTLMEQEAEKKMQNGQYKAAATLFLKTSVDWQSLGELEKSKELLEKFKFAKSYL